MFKFCSLFSGSTGNSLFVETENSKILVDAGESAKKIVSALSLSKPRDIAFSKSFAASSFSYLASFTFALNTYIRGSPGSSSKALAISLSASFNFRL